MNKSDVFVTNIVTIGDADYRIVNQCFDKWCWNAINTTTGESVTLSKWGKNWSVI